MNEHQIIETEDGSHTIYLRDINEHYHSVHGAVNESMHIFVGAGFNWYTEKMTSIRILEVGFGTGLNALLTLVRAEEVGMNVHYTALEAFPLAIETTAKLNYASIIGGAITKRVFMQMHEQQWGSVAEISDHFVLQKVHARVQDNLPETPLFDLVYFDAFSPLVQPDMWTSEVFDVLNARMVKDGTLITYSSQGKVRRSLLSCGFRVEKVPGPKGKREFIRATKL